MKISTRSILLLLFFSGCSLMIRAQPTSVNLEEQFNSYRKQAQNEKLFLHTDKELYLAGEVVWFKVYYVDGSFHNAINLSKVAYVEILDRDSRAVLQAKISLTDGSGNGSFYLPASIISGVYKLRAYTQWMKNFSTDYFFDKPFTIVNTGKTLDSLPLKGRSYEIGFFPEGGNLVQNIKSRLAFKVSDAFGRGVDGKGVIVNHLNDTVAVLQTLQFGIGHLTFTPVTGANYRAIIHISDTTIEKLLPQVREQGVVMKVFNESDSKIHVRVTSNLQAFNNARLIIHTRHILKLSEQRSLVDGTTEFIFDKARLGDGISHFTVFNEALQPLCERLYFKRPSSKLVIKAESITREFSSRSKATIQVTSKDEKGESLPADLSVSVHRVSETPFPKETDIDSYLWLTSDLRGNIESPGFYFSDTSAEVEQAADNLMLTHGWRRFLWSDLAHNKILNADFLPEFRDHILNARVINTRTGRPAEDIITYLSVPGKRVQLYCAKSDKAGRLKFYTKNLYGLNEIILQTDTRGDTSYRVEIINPFSEKISATSLPAFILANDVKNYLSEHHVSVQVQNSFLGEKLRQLYLPEIDTASFYGQADNEYMLDDYVRFSTMEEVLKEYVVEVLVRRQRENFRMMMSGGLENKVFYDDPITLFNGVPVFEANKIMQYDPLKVQKIEVVKRRYFYGPALMNGIVNFITYEPDPAMLSGLNAVVFDYEGIQFEREFYSPAYEKPEHLASRLPDFRNVLYWSPNVKTSSDGKAEFEFYTSDLKGKYMIVVQGMNNDGRTGSYSFSFEVK